MLSFSVIIPTYNRAELVVRAIKSALAQLEPGDEIIVVDDGSTDGTSDRLAAYKQAIKYVQISNSGAGAARNVGVKAARNPLIAFLDSDDEWMPGKLKLNRSLFQSSKETSFAFSDFASKDSAGIISHHHLKTWHNDTRPWSEILGNKLLFSQLGPLPPEFEDFYTYRGNLSLAEMMTPMVSTNTVVVKKSAAGPALHFAEDVPTYEDFECWGRLALAGEAVHLETETAWNHGESPDRLSHRDAYDKAFSRLTVLERVWGNAPEFLEEYSKQYNQEVELARRQLVTELLIMGRMDEARAELKKLPDAPLILQLLSRLPRFAVTSAFSARKKLKSNGA